MHNASKGLLLTIFREGSSEISKRVCGVHEAQSDDNLGVYDQAMVLFIKTF